MNQYTKAVFSSNYVEVTQQSQQPIIGRSSSGGRKSFSTQSTENYEANLKTSIRRAKKKIRRLLECNFTDSYTFLTLTFKSTGEIDITDIKSCAKKFSAFKKRLSYYLDKHNLPKFQYIGVTEFQDESRQGAIHYHLVCNLLDIPTETIQELWIYGFIYKSPATPDPTNNEKMAYYLNKGIHDHRLNGNKRYFHSQGLKQPIPLDIKDSAEFHKVLDKCEPWLTQNEAYHSPYTGETRYDTYYVKNVKELIEYAQEQ
ncbi:rolling circle replication-associated protein [Salipaludibacillus daqingensis]|uniref:rolling circle replication-associated protein n=1 Tax=Salipaludibacillus daqingensis TaxID=3041001 RepID=UPI002475C1E0|nr:hypothetical protein [Salipaludibacillus daqingensis]